MLLIVNAAVLPEHFWDGFGGAVLGAIAGGLLTAVGGYLATRRIRTLDIKKAEDQAERDYRAAVVVVLDELHANRGVAIHLRQGPHFVKDPSSVGLSDASYLALQHFLADRLSERARNHVATAYADIRARDILFDPLAYQAVGGGGSTYARAAKARALERLETAITFAITALEAERDSWAASDQAGAQHGLRWPWNRRP